jgi:nucleoside 2-deoxyribosyltransferase
MTKIFFSGSIRGLRDKQETYLELIKHLNIYGTVLTEYVSDPKLSSYGDNKRSNHQIYDRDVSWINESDIVVAEVSTPSLGVGYEIAYAEQLGKKILCLYRKQTDKKLSAMINGNKKIITKEYETIEEATMYIDNFFTPQTT